MKVEQKKSTLKIEKWIRLYITNFKGNLASQEDYSLLALSNGCQSNFLFATRTDGCTEVTFTGLFCEIKMTTISTLLCCSLSTHPKISEWETMFK